MDQSASPQPVATAPITAVWPGTPHPRGATWDGEGVNFSLFSIHATKVELCVFDPTGRRELQRVRGRRHQSPCRYGRRALQHVANV